MHSSGSAFCIPGQAGCYSYDADAWAGMKPRQILGVTFSDGSAAQHWGVVSDYGGKAEILGQTNASDCTSYGGPFCSFCIYPWFSSTAHGSWNYGVDYPDTVADLGMPQLTHHGLRRYVRSPAGTAPTNRDGLDTSDNYDQRSAHDPFFAEFCINAILCKQVRTTHMRALRCSQLPHVTRPVGARLAPNNTFAGLTPRRDRERITIHAAPQCEHLESPLSVLGTDVNS